MFLQHLVEQAYTQVKSEHATKPRRNIQYRDVGKIFFSSFLLSFLDLYLLFSFEGEEDWHIY